MSDFKILAENFGRPNVPLDAVIEQDATVVAVDVVFNSDDADTDWLDDDELHIL